MVIKASNYKNWCTENISPQAWTRIVLKCVNQVRDKGLSLKQMEDTNPDFELDADIMDALNEALAELYEMSVDESLLVRY